MSRQKLGYFLINKVFYRWLKIVFRRIKLVFDLENWLWILETSNFWRLPILSVYKILKFYLSMLISKQKAITFFIPHLKTPQLKLPYTRARPLPGPLRLINECHLTFHYFHLHIQFTYREIKFFANIIGPFQIIIFQHTYAVFISKQIVWFQSCSVR